MTSTGYGVSAIQLQVCEPQSKLLKGTLYRGVCRRALEGLFRGVLGV